MNVLWFYPTIAEIDRHVAVYTTSVATRHRMDQDTLGRRGGRTRTGSGNLMISSRKVRSHRYLRSPGIFRRQFLLVKLSLCRQFPPETESTYLQVCKSKYSLTNHSTMRQSYMLLSTWVHVCVCIYVYLRVECFYL